MKTKIRKDDFRPKDKLYTNPCNKNINMFTLISNKSGSIFKIYKMLNKLCNEKKVK